MLLKAENPPQRDLLRRVGRDRWGGSDQALVNHGVGHLDEAGDVGTGDVVGEVRRAIAGELASVVVGVAVDVDHDGVELGVNLFGGPVEALAVLSHLETGGSNTAGVGGLSRPVENLGGQVIVDTVEVGGHVGTLGHEFAAVLDEGGGLLAVDLVLRGAGESAVAGDAPGALTLEVLSTLEVLGVLADAAAAHVLELHDPSELLGVDALRVEDVAVGVGHGHDLGAELVELLDEVLGHVAGTGDHADLALQVIVLGSKHLLCEVDAAVTGRLRADERAAPVEGLAGEHARELIAQTLVLAEEVADLATAHTDVAGGHVGVRADVALQLRHEALAETHHLHVALTLGVEVGTALAAAHGERGEGVLEDLLEAEELEDTQVDGGVESQAALVGPDGAVELNAETAVDADVALVILPRHAEDDGTLRLGDALKNAVVFVLLVSGENGSDGGDNLLNGLQELRLAGVFGANLLQYSGCIIGHCLYLLAGFTRRR